MIPGFIKNYKVEITLLSILTAFAFINFSAGAQVREVDSLRALIPAIPKDTSDVKNMVALSMGLFHEGSFDSALHLAIQARKLSEKLKYKKGIGTALLASGYAYKLQGSYEASINDFNEALLIFQGTNDNFNIGKSHSFLAQSYQSMGMQEKAMEHLQLARKYIEKIGYQAGLAVIYLDIGRYHSEKANYEVALAYYLQSLKASESIQAISKMAIAMNNIGVVYERLEQYEKALKYFTEGLALIVKGGIVAKKPLLLINQGGIYIKLNKLDDADRSIAEGLSLAHEQGDKEFEATALKNMGQLFAKKRLYSEAEQSYKRSVMMGREINNPDLIMSTLLQMAKFYFTQNKIEKSVSYAHEAMKISQQLKAKEYTKDIYQLNAQLDSALGNYKGAFSWHKKYSELNDSLLMSRKSANILYLQNLLDEKEKELKLKKPNNAQAQLADDSLSSNTRILLLLSLLFIITLLVLLFLALKLKIRTRELTEIADRIKIALPHKEN